MTTGISETPHQLAIASTLIPWSFEDTRGLYFGYRACGFSEAEALVFSEAKPADLEEWRTDPEFLATESRMPGIRDQLAKEYIYIESLRNLRMFLEKDRRIIQDALSPRMIPVTTTNKKTGEKTTRVIPCPMSPQDHEYLLKIRSQYSPQLLSTLREAANGNGDPNFNWAKAVMDMAKRPGAKVKVERLTVSADGQT